MDAQWLKAQFECNPGKSKADLARALKLEPPAISKILNGTRQIKAQEYQAMRRYFGLPVDGERALPSEAYQLETLAGNQAMLHEGLDDPEGNWSIPDTVSGVGLNKGTKTSPQNIKIFTVQESVMEPDYVRGEQVLVDLSDRNIAQAGAFIVYDGFGFMLRICENAGETEVKISATDPSFQTQTIKQDLIEIKGRVVAKLQWLWN